MCHCGGFCVFVEVFIEFLEVCGDFVCHYGGFESLCDDFVCHCGDFVYIYGGFLLICEFLSVFMVILCV